MRPSSVRLYSLVMISLMVAACEGSYAMPVAADDPTADTLGKSLAQLFLAKEESVPAAKHSMGHFQAITQEHILQNGVDIKAKQAQELIQYQQSEITDPTLKYLSETLSQHLQGLQPNATEIADAKQPDLGYLTDPKQNVVKDFFKFATRSGTSAGSVAGPDFIDSAPCLIANTPVGIGVNAAAVSVVPQLFAATPYGVSIIPQGINIQPALIQIKVYGVDISPIALDIEPILISIRPHMETIGPQAINIGPSLINVKGRKLLADDSSQQEGPSYGDLFLQSYEKWMQVVTNMAMGREATPQEANSFLAKVFDSTNLHLDSFQQLSTLFEGLVSHQGVFNQSQDFTELVNEFSQLYPVEILQEVLNGSLSNPNFNVTSLLPTGVSYTDPKFFHDQATNITSSLQGASVSSSFINYKPCLVVNTPNGINIGPAGVVVQPEGVVVKTSGVNVQPRAINIQPSIVYVSPVGESVVPEGIQIIPTLINIDPTFHQVGKHLLPVGSNLISVDKDGKVKFNSKTT